MSLPSVKLMIFLMVKGLRKLLTKSNLDGIQKTIEVLGYTFKGLAFTNLVDFDSFMVIDVIQKVTGRALEEFDAYVATAESRHWTEGSA